VTLAAGLTQSDRVQLLAANAVSGNREQAFSNLWIVEGPGVVYYGDSYWLYYAAGGEAYSTSGGNFANYSFNLSNPSATFPAAFTKRSQPMLISGMPNTGTYRSPGHGGMLQDGGGNWWLVFHTHDSTSRMLWLQQLYYDFTVSDFKMVQGGGLLQQSSNYAPTP
jgi:hypothetical protein